jgi:hypothetical protein
MIEIGADAAVVRLGRGEGYCWCVEIDVRGRRLFDEGGRETGVAEGSLLLLKLFPLVAASGPVGGVSLTLRGRLVMGSGRPSRLRGR